MWKVLPRGALALALLLAFAPASAQQVWKWSQTSGSNATADPSINWATGMAPSQVSPSARAMMSAVARYRDDNAGRLTTSGTSTAYTLVSNTGYPTTPNDGTAIAVTPHATNGAAPTLAVDSGTAFPIRVDATNAVPAATLVAGSPYVLVFNSSASAWILHGFYGSPTTVPIGAIIAYTGASAPNSNFALAYGQAISRATYAGLFSLIGQTFGPGDGSTTFNLPDLRGRVIAGLGNMGGTDAGRITTAGGNFDGTVLGAAGGAQNWTLTTAQLPTFTPSGTISSFTPSGAVSSFTPSGSISSFTPSGSVSVSINGQGSGTLILSPGLIAPGTASSNVTVSALTASATFSGNSITPTFFGNSITPSFSGNSITPTFSGVPIGSGNAHPILQPTMVLPFIIRIF